MQFIATVLVNKDKQAIGKCKVSKVMEMEMILLPFRYLIVPKRLAIITHHTNKFKLNPHFTSKP